MLLNFMPCEKKAIGTFLVRNLKCKLWIFFFFFPPSPLRCLALSVPSLRQPEWIVCQVLATLVLQSRKSQKWAKVTVCFIK